MEDSSQKAKDAVALKAYEYLSSRFHKDTILGIGTGSTANFFIKYLIENKPEIIDIYMQSPRMWLEI